MRPAFDGEISVSLPPSQFFSDSSFFTTDSAKIAKTYAIMFTLSQGL